MKKSVTVCDLCGAVPDIVSGGGVDLCSNCRIDKTAGELLGFLADREKKAAPRVPTPIEMEQFRRQVELIGAQSSCASSNCEGCRVGSFTRSTHTCGWRR